MKPWKSFQSKLNTSGTFVSIIEVPIRQFPGLDKEWSLGMDAEMKVRAYHANAYPA